MKHPHDKNLRKRKFIKTYILCASTDDGACSACQEKVVSGSFIYNVCSTLIKGVVGLLTGSKALVADAVHSFTDCAGFGINYFGARAKNMSEFLQSTLVGSIMLLSGVWICSDSIAIMICQTPPRPGVFALLVAFVSALVNAHLYRISACIHRQDKKNGNIFMCMVQNRINYFASCIAFLGILLAVSGFVFFDPLTAIVIGLLQIYGAAQIFKDSFDKEGFRTARTRQRILLSLGAVSLCIFIFFTHDVCSVIGKRQIILIPSDGTTIESPASDLLGRAPYFYIVNMKERITTVQTNASRLYNVEESLVLGAIVDAKRIGVVLAQKVGPDMFSALRSRNVRIYYGIRPGTVGSLISDYMEKRLKLAVSPNTARGFGRSQVRWLAPW